jgi:hypothetical protein
MVIGWELKKDVIAAAFIALGLLVTAQGLSMAFSDDAMADEGDTTGSESGADAPETSIPAPAPDNGAEGDTIVPSVPSDGQDTQQTTGGKPG